MNTLVSKGDGDQYVTDDEWDAAAAAQGMRVIRRPQSNPSRDVGNEVLLAWMQRDEPDVEATNNSYCSAFTSADAQYPCIAECEANAQSWRAADPSRAVFVNFSGSDVLGSASCNFCNGTGDGPDTCPSYPRASQCYPRLIAAADWISEDVYPVTGWIQSELRNDLSVPGKVVDKLRGWTDKPVFACIETSDQNLPGYESLPGVTPGQFRAEVWNAIIHGARGIVYFPFDVGTSSWSYDTTPADVVEEMKVQNALITQLAGTLQGEINPSAVGASAAAPLDVGWRNTSAAAYFLVLNLSSNSIAGASITLTGVTGATTADVHGEARTVSVSNGVVTDDFGPHALHVYVVRH